MHVDRRPGTPRLLRELNDRAALELLLAGGPMTRAQLGERTGLSKVTASQLLARLEERGLVQVAGEQAGGRGPNAAIYGVVPSSAYVVGLHVEQDEVSAGVADVTGRVVTEVSVDPNGGGHPVELVRAAVLTACDAAGVSPEALRAFVIGTPGVLDPRTGDLRLAVNLPTWHEGVHDALRAELGRPVTIENDVNLAAMAEREIGAARGVDDFVLVWIGVGLGLATILGGRLHRGVGGAAGEIGYLPVPGVPLPQDLTHPATGAFQSLVGAQAVLPLAASYGFDAPNAAAAVRAAVRAAAAVAAGAAGQSAGTGQRAEEFLADMAIRVATGVAAVSVVLDPGLVVLGGEVGLAGGAALASRVAAQVGRICPARPEVVPTGISRGPVLRGAILAAVNQARADLLESVASLKAVRRNCPRCWCALPVRLALRAVSGQHLRTGWRCWPASTPNGKGAPCPRFRPTASTSTTRSRVRARLSS
jgi:predicted NBD/HSP70 family sugar kinase